MALCALLAACGGDTIAPVNLGRSYQLISYDGHSPPFEIGKIIAISPTTGQTLSTCSRQLTGGLLEFFDGSRYQSQESRAVVCDDGRPNELSNLVIPGTYTVSGNALQLNSDAFVTSPEVSSTMTTIATVNGDDITVSERVVHQAGLPAGFDFETLIYHVQK